MGHSFRLRLAISSALLAGVTLFCFAAIAWWQMRNAKIGDLDREFLAQTEREMSRFWPADHWPRHEQNLGKAFGTHHVQQTLLLVEEGNALVYRSGHWPEGLDSATLPWPPPQNPPMPGWTNNAGRTPTEPPPPRPPPPRDDQDSPPPPPNDDAHPPLPAVLATLSLNIGDSHWRFGLAATPYERMAIGIDLAVVLTVRSFFSDFQEICFD
ncbi:hypothetical protein CCP4SC76_5580022 [Gammaproteobacteria bacterium]